MSCPFFEEVYFGTCHASNIRYAPTIETMEHYCFKKLHRFCPILLGYQAQYSEV
jgi:hypothetical protein